jgi:hypothetical protein
MPHGPPDRQSQFRSLFPYYKYWKSPRSSRGNDHETGAKPGRGGKKIVANGIFFDRAGLHFAPASHQLDVGGIRSRDDSTPGWLERQPGGGV